MPIYEYRCEACGSPASSCVPRQTRLLHAGPAGSPQTQRVMSRFAHHRSEASRLAVLDASVPHGPDFYKDSRNVGLWAKKRAQKLGVNLGAQFEETVEKARTGKILDEV